eukprot:g616.t1
MADENGDDDADGEEGGKKKKVSGKKLVLFIVLPILLLAGAGAGVFMSGLLDPLLGVESEATDEAAEEQPAETEVAAPGHFLPLDEMTVSLRSNGGRARFLKLQLTLELESPEDEPRVQAVMPRIVDNFQVFLRELRVEELEGSAGIYRIREELLERVNQAADPVKVREVLFTDMLIQ